MGWTIFEIRGFRGLMQNRRMRCRRVVLGLLVGWTLCLHAEAQKSLNLDEAVALARKQNPEILIARKQLEAARGGIVEAKAGYFPSVLSSGLLRQRQRQELSRLREDDYNASLRVVQSVYTGGATAGRMAIARLNAEKRALELTAIEQRVVMDLRVAYYELLLNRAKIGVREQAVRVMREELKAQEERLAAGTVGELNVRRAEVSLANEQPELFEAQTRVQNSNLRINELCGVTANPRSRAARFEPTGQLIYRPRHPDLTESLLHARAVRAEIKARELDVAIEEQQLIVDRSELRPRVEVFTGYEVYSERDPEVGSQFNHGYVVGLNAGWHIFDGFATRGRMQATRARREAAAEALQAARLSVESEVRSAFFDLQQADRVLESETINVESASESLELARGNLGAGLGTQLDVLQAAADVTRVRTTRLSAIFLHNVALARLARATGREPEELGFRSRAATEEDAKRHPQMFDVARPPQGLNTR
ncbi:MAG: TolC family protein [Verrucomicrobiota bacterium]|nr:TolC family protein [Verrucomicrobiota bacterium]